MMRDVLAVDGANVLHAGLSLRATTALGVHSLSLRVNLLGIGARLGLHAKIHLSVINAVLFVLDLTASLAVLNMLHRVVLDHSMNVVMTHMTLHGQLLSGVLFVGEAVDGLNVSDHNIERARSGRAALHVDHDVLRIIDF